MSEAPTVRVGVLGLGTVGSALVRLVSQQTQAIEMRTGIRVEVTRAAVRNLDASRDLGPSAPVIVSDPMSVVEADDVDLVVELMGGVDPARSLIERAIRLRKPVVSANKELIASCSRELFELADSAGVDLLFEASVAGGIPLLRAIRESLAGDRIRRVLGIVNGTTNFILTQMTEQGTGFDEALAEAQELGYAEADPTADVEGFDAAAKAAIIATLAFGADVTSDDVSRQGITAVTSNDIAAAAALGYTIKLLAVVERSDGGIGARVAPAMIPNSHPLASVREAFNALFIEADAVGELMLYGRGAGGMPTASAVLGDVVDAAKNLVGGGAPRHGSLESVPMLETSAIESQYAIRMSVADESGVLAEIASEFGRHGVSIESVRQRGAERHARLTFVTHSSNQDAVQATLSAVEQLDCVVSIDSVIAVIGAAT
ncbi:MAG: homoserine dehydrogenase [Acidimicrobiia bacterium]|jgi:homoserine dehydrogenase|nr:homoserine dehydrogenase [Acidimicrobiia bacterium]MBP8179677.1 homoserine dehydrogenase [Acidimicrobiia bacterium]